MPLFSSKAKEAKYKSLDDAKLLTKSHEKAKKVVNNGAACTVAVKVTAATVGLAAVSHGQEIVRGSFKSIKNMDKEKMIDREIQRRNTDRALSQKPPLVPRNLSVRDVCVESAKGSFRGGIGFLFDNSTSTGPTIDSTYSTPAYKTDNDRKAYGYP